MSTKKLSQSFRFLFPVMLLALMISWLASPQSSAATYNVTIDPGTTYQTLEGFGAAAAWYAGWIPAHPNKTELYDVLFNDLGLDIIRFRNTYGSRDGEEFAPAEAEILAGAKRAAIILRAARR
jgi:glucuronoarabinoxylan endo-1,4-beta-xylanase